MTDIKRMEKPTDLICEKCGRPLVIKWGKHGSFIACTGYPDFSSKSIESDLEKVQKDIEVRRQRALKNIEIKRGKAPGKVSPGDDRVGRGRRVHRDARFSAHPKAIEAALRKLEKEIAAKRLEDRGKIELRLEKLQARYPQMKGFYDLDLRDTGEGVALTVRRKEEFCTYTRELTVDLPDLEGADLSDQGDEELCENCGRPMVLKKGRFGTFFACSEYPDCKTTKQIGGTQKKDVPLDEKCPQCDSNLVMKYGRFGEFTACSNYPTCKYVKQKTIGVKCPECSEGEIIERRSKKGKTFYGCNRYPDCTFVAWGKPVPEKCPECGSPYMVEKLLKAGAVLAVSQPRVQTQGRAPVVAEVIAQLKRHKAPLTLKFAIITGMSLFKWSSAHSIYLPEIDAEHRAIYRLGDELHKALLAGADPAQLKPILANLLESAEEHFRHEERLMRAMHYAAFEWHKRQHDAARKRAKALAGRIEGGDAAAAGELLQVPLGLAARSHERGGPHDGRLPAQLSALQHFARVVARVVRTHHEGPPLAELAAHSQVAGIVAGGLFEARAAQRGVDLPGRVAAFVHLHVAAPPFPVEQAEHGDRGTAPGASGNRSPSRRAAARGRRAPGRRRPSSWSGRRIPAACRRRTARPVSAPPRCVERRPAGLPR